MGTKEDEMRLEILKMMREESEPLGAGVISDLLAQAGIFMSEAGIGRALRRLRNEGLLNRVGYRGHRVTDKGLVALDELEERARLASALDAFRNRAAQDGDAALIEVMRMMKPLACETALLAAQNANDDDVKALEELIASLNKRDDDEKMLVGRNNLFSQFHYLLVKASKQPLLENFFDLIHAMLLGKMRKGELFTKATADIGMSTYQALIEAVRNHDGELAVIASSLQVESMIAHMEKSLARKTQNA